MPPSHIIAFFTFYMAHWVGQKNSEAQVAGTNCTQVYVLYISYGRMGRTKGLGISRLRVRTTVLAIFSYILYQKIYQNTFFNHQNQIQLSVSNHTGGADFGRSRLVVCYIKQNVFPEFLHSLPSYTTF